jgi:DNA-binding transcriptional LysR family regulator
MNLKHLQSFARVAELGRSGSAGRVLDLAQPAPGLREAQARKMGACLCRP